MHVSNKKYAKKHEAKLIPYTLCSSGSSNNVIIAIVVAIVVAVVVLLSLITAHYS